MVLAWAGKFVVDISGEFFFFTDSGEFLLTNEKKIYDFSRIFF